MKKERKIRKILGPQVVGEEYRLTSKKEIKKYTEIHSDIRKLRLKLYGHIKQMTSNRLTKKIMEFYKNRSSHYEMGLVK